jgi:ppGpp synthetase/RelA/SpoT-type nucleotidyltranferase
MLKSGHSRSDPHPLGDRDFDFESFAEAVQKVLRAVFHQAPSENLIGHFFNVYSISARVKSKDSLAKKGKDKYPNTLNALLAFAKEDSDYRDFIGLRFITEDQSTKYRIVRALNDAIKSKLNLVSGDTALRLSAMDEAWKYINPPLVYLYSTPRVLQVLDSKVRGLIDPDFKKEEADLWTFNQDGEEQPNRQSVTPANQQLSIGKHLKAIEDLLAAAGVRVKYDDSGYSSLQRVLYARLNNAELPIEIQVRTLLEETWASVHHRRIYKGEASEHTKLLFASFKATLVAADDQLQLLLDQAMSEQPAILIPFQAFDRHYDLRLRAFDNLSFIGKTALRSNLGKTAEHRRFGRFGEAIRVLRGSEKLALRNIKSAKTDWERGILESLVLFDRTSDRPAPLVVDVLRPVG